MTAYEAHPGDAHSSHAHHARASIRQACLNAFMALLAQKSVTGIDLADVARGAGVSLCELRAVFTSVEEMLAAFFRETDRKVLAEGGPDDDLAQEEPRERLFEVLMRRLDALEPHKPALRRLMQSARRNPLLALRLARLSESSQRWMLAAAGLNCTGLSGEARAKGLAVLFSRVVAVWLDDDAPGLDRTMAVLDRELENGAKLLGMLDDALFILLPWRSRRRKAAAGQDPTASPA